MTPAAAAEGLLSALRASQPAEIISDSESWSRATPQLSIAIPSYRYDSTRLLTRLSECAGASEVEIILYEDGGGDVFLNRRLQARVRSLQIPARLIAANINRGRASARNAAIAHARAPWILLLDADMLPDNAQFLNRYLAIAQTSEPCAIVGGYSLRQAPHDPRFALHRWQAKASEMKSAAERQGAPGLHVYSCNVLVHRDALAACPFDAGFSGWGWEDTDWGLRLEASFPIMHIDNPCSHMGLDDDDALLRKYSQGAPNFARLIGRHPQAMARSALLCMARLLADLPCRPLLIALSRALVTSRLPVVLRGRALKLWRALVYADALTQPPRAEAGAPSPAASAHRAQA